ncbi:cupin domain-containing protein [Paraburkholderia pallida]|uniref:Cupin domain-containing protein n=1 Tax=Paraburkholderia pallida TaxID=2547399 RepID=A0A4P7D105_9BURK|nr:cupin domain-containing protein [Paraburkholderia pallida]QBR02289.1 cupin domain-containing protein [Paraburkholderia pallida]
MHRLSALASVSIAFACGYLAARMGLPPAYAQTPTAALAPQIINLAAMTNEEIGPQVPNMGTLRTKILVATPYGTVAVQSGNVPRHYHTSANEIQYIIAGRGTFWLGSEQREVGPGDLIVVPEGVAHAGSIATSGEFKALTIKLPPQAAGDTHMLP